MDEDTVLKNEITAVVDKIKGKYPDVDPANLQKALEQIIIENKSPAEAMGFSEKFIEVSYSCAYKMYQSGKYNDAIEIFKLLQFLKPQDTRFTLGLAKSYENRGDFALAGTMYLALTQLEPTNPSYYWNLYLCCEKLGNKRMCIYALSFLCYITNGEEENASYYDKAKIVLDKLNEEMAEEKKQRIAEKMKEKQEG